MRISVLLAHPGELSFNHAIARTAVEQLRNNGHLVFFHDLYREEFDPLLWQEEIPGGANVPEPIMAHCREIAEAEGIVVVHPNWWGQPPAILKGWVDRVLRAGVAYEFFEDDSGGGMLKGLLKAQTALVFTTSNTTPEVERERFGDPLDTLWRNCIFGQCGVEGFYRMNFGVIITSRKDLRKQWLDEVRRWFDRFFPGEKHFAR